MKDIENRHPRNIIFLAISIKVGTSRTGQLYHIFINIYIYIIKYSQAISIGAAHMPLPAPRHLADGSGATNKHSIDFLSLCRHADD